MSDNKTEQPTDQKLKKLREEGQLPARKNVVEAGLLIFSVSILLFIIPRMGTAMMELLKSILDDIVTEDPRLTASSLGAAMQVLYLLIGFCGASTLFTLFATLLLSGFNIAPKALAPKFEKFNPVSRVKSIFAKTNFYNFLRLLIFFTITSFVVYAIIHANISDAINASFCGVSCLAPLFISILKHIVIAILIILTVLAAADFSIQTRLFLGQNKMSKDDVKREHKEQNGNPEVKAGRGAIAQNDAHAPTLDQSTHVIYDDIFLTCVIYYKENKLRPYVVGKFKGPSVQKALSQLKEKRVALFYMPNVAADFYRIARPNQYMPPASASIMAKVTSEEEQRQQNAAAL